MVFFYAIRHFLAVDVEYVFLTISHDFVLQKKHNLDYSMVPIRATLFMPLVAALLVQAGALKAGWTSNLYVIWTVGVSAYLAIYMKDREVGFMCFLAGIFSVLIALYR